MGKDRAKSPDEEFDFSWMFDDPEEDLEFIEEFKPSADELKLLARHYFDELQHHAFYQTFYPEGVSTTQFYRELLWSVRLRRIENALGRDRYEAAICSVDAKWKEEFDAAGRKLALLSPCRKCGLRREFDDVVHGDNGFHLGCAESE